MADLRVKKGGSNNKKHKHDSLSIIKALPEELLVEIVGKVASRSIFDLCKVKLSCKEFLNAAETDYVYQNASLDKFALVPLPWFTNEKESSFLKRCRESGNLEILYREGMVQYFSSLRVKSGLENLKKAALEGNHEAKYVYSMILMSCEDETERKHGFDLFRSLKTSTCITRCRKRVKSFIRSMWVNNPVLSNHRSSLCRSSTCGSAERVQQKLSRRSSSLAEDEDDAIGVSCEYCDGDYELGWGLVARNYKGEALFAATKKERIQVSSLLAEALGLRWGLQWATDQHMGNLEIECDAVAVVKCVYGISMIAEIENTMLDCRDF